MTNLFTDNSVCELGITFLHEGNKYACDFKYDTEKEEYVYERFVQILKDRYANEKEEVWLLKDTENKEFHCGDDGLGLMMSALASNSLLIYLIDTSKFEKMLFLPNRCMRGKPSARSVIPIPGVFFICKKRNISAHLSIVFR